MKIYTVPKSRVNLIPSDHHVISVDSIDGTPGIAPSDELFRQLRTNDIDVLNFVDKYYNEMRISFDSCRMIWKDIVDHSHVTIVHSDNFAEAHHCSTIVKILSKICQRFSIEFEDEGELREPAMS